VIVKAEHEALCLIGWGPQPHHVEVEGVEETGPVEEAWVHQKLGKPVKNYHSYLIITVTSV
jgi:hypothetical protein